MCGIAGYISFGKKKPNKEELEILFKGIETRGTDSTGLAFVKNKKLNVIKRPITASEFIKTDIWKNLKVPKMMIMHTRALTQGDKFNPKNNHPIYNNGRYALVHNGIISNYDEYGTDNDTVDSMAILKAVEEHYDGTRDSVKKLVATLSGGQAVALLDEQNPNRLVLWRHTNPLHLALDPEKEILYFASKGEFYDGIGEEEIHVGPITATKKNLIINELKNNSGVIIDMDSVVHFDIKTKKYELKDYNYGTGSRYYSTTEPKLVKCPKCGQLTTLNTEAYYGDYCEHCRSYITKFEISRLKEVSFYDAVTKEAGIEIPTFKQIKEEMR